MGRAHRWCPNSFQPRLRLSMMPNVKRVIPPLVAVVIATVSTGCSSSGSNPTASTPVGLRRAAQLAAQGNAADLTQIGFKSIKGLASCSHPNWYATADPSITGRHLAADELAFFQQRTNLDRGDCSAFLYVFRPGHVTINDGYGAGAVIDDDHAVQIVVGSTGAAPFITFKYGN